MGDDGITKLAAVFEAGGCSGLEHLDLSKNGFSDRGLRAIAQAVTSKASKIELSILNVSRNNIKAQGTGFLFRRLQCKGLRSLAHLDLSSNSIPSSPFQKDLLKAIRHGCCREWVQISLSHNPLGDEGLVPMLDELAETDENWSCSELTHLNLAGIDARDPSMDALSHLMAVGRLRMLDTLDLSDNRIHAVGMRVLATALRTRSCPRLRGLNLANNLLGDDGINQLCIALQLHGGTRLHTLNIAYNGGVHSMVHLSMVLKGKTCPELQILAITGNYNPDTVRVKRLFKDNPHLSLC